MPSDYGNNARRAEGEPALQADSYSDAEKALANREHTARQGKGVVIYGGDRGVAAEASKTLLGHERIIRGHSIKQAADRCGLSEVKYKGLEDGWASEGALTSTEKAALQKYAFGTDVEVLLSENSPGNRAKLAGRF